MSTEPMRMSFYADPATSTCGVAPPHDAQWRTITDTAVLLEQLSVVNSSGCGEALAALGADGGEHPCRELDRQLLQGVFPRPTEEARQKVCSVYGMDAGALVLGRERCYRDELAAIDRLGLETCGQSGLANVILVRVTEGLVLVVAAVALVGAGRALWRRIRAP